MTSGKFTDEIYIQKPPEQVLSFQADLLNLSKTHPLIVKIEKIDTERNGTACYSITDLLKWGPFSFSIEYFAEIAQVAGDTLRSEARQKPGIRVINITRIIPQSGGCLVQEESTIEAPALLFGYVFSKARDAHKLTLINLKKFLESSGG